MWLPATAGLMAQPSAGKHFSTPSHQSEFSRKVSFASEDAHSARVSRSEASPDAEAVLCLDGLSERNPVTESKQNGHI